MQQDRVALLTGLGVGAGLMYLLDPDRGRRRRAVVRDQVTHTVKRTGDAADTTARDLAHRTTGTWAAMRQRFAREPVDDQVLVERVRARLGRLIAHPHAVEVTAADGVVTLRGPILAHETARLLRNVRRVRGVRDVVNALDEHKEAGKIPALQGGRTPGEPRPDVLQRHWSPATRLIAASSGMALTAYGMSRRTIPGALMSVTGIGMFARAATNLELRRLTGVGARRRAVDIQKTITIDAPVDEVFGFWTAYENFPRFMSHVHEVRQSAREDQSHWTVDGPAGVRVTFDAEVTARVPNQVFAWRTLPGSVVAHAGIVRFEPAGERQTRVQIRMSYNPPGGWIGHGIAAAFGVDPKRSLDADLLRMKTLIETGHAPRDAAQPAAGSDEALPT